MSTFYSRRGNTVAYSSEFVGTAHASVPESSGFDDLDFAILELPPRNLSNLFSAVPIHMIASSITLKHIETISLIGYPVGKNKYRFGIKHNTLNSVSLEIPHNKSKYDTLGLNPITHFCATFNHKEMTDPDGRISRPLNPAGLSGAPAWFIPEGTRRTGRDEGASLLGIVSEYDETHNVIWGPRINYALNSVANTLPELAEGFAISRPQRTVDPEEIRYFRLAMGKSDKP